MDEHGEQHVKNEDRAPVEAGATAETTPSPAVESEYPEELERRFSEPILKGQEGIETAQVWISAFLVVIAAVIAYSNAFTLPFQLADRELLFGNDGLQRWSEFNEALAADPRQPVAMLALGLNSWLGPDVPVAFRVASIALHVLASVLVYLLGRRLLAGKAPESVAMLAGLLFALHPLATESVNLVAARGSLLAAVFAVASVLLFLRATEADGGLRPGAYAGSLLCLVLAWGSHPAVVGLPVLVLAADWIVRGARVTAKRFLAHLGYWGVLLTLFAAHMAAFAVPAGVAEPEGMPFVARLAALFQQLAWTVAPHSLSAFHAVPSGDAAESQALIAAVATLALLAAGLVLVWRRSAGGFALLWFAVMQLGWAVMARPESALSEYQAYLPLAGAVLLLPWAFGLVPAVGRLRPIAGLAAAVLLVAAGIGTFSRNQDWQTPESLWRAAIAENPDAATPHLRLGRILMDGGVAAMSDAAVLASQNKQPEALARQQEAVQQFRAAEEEIRAALGLEPERVEALYALGQAMEALGRPADALDAYRRVLVLDPEHPDALWHMAIVTGAQAQPGDIEAAARSVELYRRADETGRLPDRLLVAYGQALASVGAFDESREVLTRAAAKAQGPAQQEQVKAALDRVAGMAQNVANAQQQAMAALQQDPESAGALRARGQVLAATGHTQQAAYFLDAALDKGPQDGNAWVLLGLARARMGSAARFVEEWPTPPPSATGSGPWHSLTRAAAGSGYWDAARTYIEAAGRAGELGSVQPPIALADVALELQQPARATEILQQAAEANPTDPMPWLRLTDIAAANNDLPAARTYYLKAQERNAPPEELAKRKEKIGDVPTDRGPAILR